MWNDFFRWRYILEFGWGPDLKNLPPPPLLLYYIYEKCKPYCKWRGSMPGLSVEIVSVKLILGCIFQIIDFIWTLAAAGSDWTTDWRSRGFIISPVMCCVRIELFCHSTSGFYIQLYVTLKMWTWLTNFTDFFMSTMTKQVDWTEYHGLILIIFFFKLINLHFILYPSN